MAAFGEVEVEVGSALEGQEAPVHRPDDDRLRTMMDAVPAAIYAVDAHGRLTWYNRAAAVLAGRIPIVGADRWCVALRLFTHDGKFLPHSQCPMALTLRTGRPVKDTEIVVERPDGRRLKVMAYPSVLRDKSGRIVGGVNMLVDLSELKSARNDALRRLDEQTALYQFTDRLYRAETLGQIYEAALDAILEALRCPRAAILLFDEGGAMRFVASRGLSQDYRRAVDGYSPWKPEDEDPDPIAIPDVAASDLPDELRAAIRKEGIEALSFVPLASGGRVIGKFVAAYETRHEWARNERNLAVTIARQLGFGIERKQDEERRRATESELRQYGERLRLATQAGKVGLWDWEIGTDRIAWTDSLFAIHGMDKSGPPTGLADWLERVHPDDREFVARSVERAVRDDAPYELEMRTLKPDGQVGWVYANATVSREDGQPVRMAGATVDITERKQAEMQRDLMVAELNHRVKNTLATVLSIARQSFAHTPDPAEARRSIESRIRALAQTHSRLADAHWSGVPLETILRDELAPYLGDGGANVTHAGPAVTFRPKLAVVLGMAFHELATNAAKYGALSRKTGHVDVSWHFEADGRRLVVEWVETGGPPVSAPGCGGFGRLLLERALAADIGGGVDLDFAPTGLRCTIALPLTGE